MEILASRNGLTYDHPMSEKQTIRMKCVCFRDVLAETLGDTVFFAGEATHPAMNPCIQAAIETGQRAAAQVLAARSRRQDSKL